MNLIQLRKSLNKNQKDMAQMLNIATSTYSGYELEKSEPSIDTLIKLADYYNVSLDYLVGRKWKNELGSLRKEEVDYINALLKLNQQNRIKILGYAISLLAEQE